MQKVIGVLLIIGLSQSLWAQGRAYHYVAPRSPNSQTPQGASVSTAEGQLRQSEATKGTGNIQKLADKASKNQKMTMMISTAAAAYAGYQAYVNAVSCKKGNGGACVKAALWGAGAGLSAAQAMKMSKAKSVSDASYDGVTVDMDPSNPNNPANSSNGQDLSQDPNIQEAQRHLDKAKENGGVSVDLVKGTLIQDGKTVDLASAGPGDLGLSPAEMGQLSAMMTEAFNEAEKKVGAGVDKLDGDVFESDKGAASSSIADIDYVDQSLGNSGLSKDKKINRDPSQVAGLTKNYNGDPIGVAEENLFTLINRRYQIKAQNDAFILKKK